MARFVVRCLNRRCGLEFVSNAVNISHSTGVRISRMSQTCPRCGSEVSSIDGTYDLPDAESEDLIDVRGGIARLFKEVKQPVPVARALAFELEDLETRIRSSPPDSHPVLDTSAADASPYRDQVAEVRKGLFERVFGRRFEQMNPADQIALLGEARQVLTKVIAGAAFAYGASKAPDVASTMARSVTSGEDQIEQVVGERRPQSRERPDESAEGGELVPRREGSDEVEHGQTQQQDGREPVHMGAVVVMSRHEVFYAAKAFGGPEVLANVIGVSPDVIQRGIEIGLTDPALARSILGARASLAP